MIETRGTDQDYRVVNYQGTDVCWLPELDGGGRRFGQDYLPVVGHLFGRAPRIFEFCAGPGFIGFSLLAAGFCDTLTLADVNPAAVAAMRETVRRNGLADRVSVHLSDGLADLPARERFDLVVSNPPHFAEPVGPSASLITDDPQWRLHRSFYAGIGKHLAPGGSVLLQENSEGSSPEDFIPMIEAAGLTYIRTLWYSGGGNATFFYVWAKAALTGLSIGDNAPPELSIDLADAAGAPVQVRAGTVLSLRVHNSTTRPVQPRMTDSAGTELWWLPLETTAPGQSRLLPRLTLRAGDYVISDAADGVPLSLVRATD